MERSLQLVFSSKRMVGTAINRIHRANRLSLLYDLTAKTLHQESEWFNVPFCLSIISMSYDIFSERFCEVF